MSGRSVVRSLLLFFIALLIAVPAMPAWALEETFDGSTLPADWFTAAWAPGGAATVVNGRLTVDGARAGTTAVFTAGRSLEFVATFTGDPWQHIGFGDDYNVGRWVTFSTFFGGQLYARTNADSGEFIDTPLPGVALGVPHRFRIDWGASSVVFSVDDVVVATHAATIANALRPLISDFTTGSSLTVETIEMFTSVLRTEFSDPELPSGWFSAAWAAGGAATLAGGHLTVDGARAGTEALYGPGRSLEFVATFTGDQWQHIGFGIDYNDGPWIVFSTFRGGQLYARTRSESGELIDTPLTGEWLGTSHRYRIDWNATKVVFSIDGVIVATHDTTVGGSLRPLISDYDAGGGVLDVDELEMVVSDFNLDFTSVPDGWSSGAWHAGGSARVAGGLLTVDGAWTGTTALYGPGRTLEFVATFTGDPWQHIGFGIDYYAAPWIIFSTFQGGQLYARTRSESGEMIDTPIPGDWFGAPHQFRIEWGEASIVFSLDGVVVATHDVTVGASARPLVSDFETGGGVLTVDSLTMTP